MDWKKELGIQIREGRSDSFLRQEDVRERADVHINMISRYERGEAAPELDVFVRLATAIGREEFRIGEYRVLIKKTVSGTDSDTGPKQMRLEYGKEYIFEGGGSTVKIEPQKEGLFIKAGQRKTSA